MRELEGSSTLQGFQALTQDWTNILHTWVQDFYQVPGVGVRRKAPGAFSGSSSALDEFQSEKLCKPSEKPMVNMFLQRFAAQETEQESVIQDEHQRQGGLQIATAIPFIYPTTFNMCIFAKHGSSPPWTCVKCSSEAVVLQKI